MPTIKDVARRAHVSVATVSYVLTGARAVSPERRQRVLDAIEDLNYVPDASARGLRSRRTRVIGLALSDLRNPYYPDLANGCQTAARARGYSVVIYNAYGNAEPTRELEDALRGGGVEGLIVASATPQDRTALLRMQAFNPHIVLAHRPLSDVPLFQVIADNEGGAAAVTRHLVEQGAKSILYIEGYTASGVNEMRRTGYQRVIEDAGLSARIEVTDGSEPAVYEVTRKALTSTLPPDAVLASSDTLALAVIDAVRDLRMEMPGDVMVAGFDNLFFAGARSISLTSVHVDRERIGKLAAEHLIDALESRVDLAPEKIEVPTALMVRNTTTGNTSR